MEQNRRKQIQDISLQAYNFIKDELKIDSDKRHITLDSLEKFLSNLNGKFSISNELPIYEKGRIVKLTGNESFEILVNSTIDNDEKKRFLIAHELGHLFFHMSFLDKTKVWKDEEDTFYDSLHSRRNYAVNEVEADIFAESLLMPFKKLKDVMKEFSDENRNIDMSKVAQEFDVSERTITDYMINNNLIQYEAV